MTVEASAGWTFLVNVFPDEGRCVAVARWCCVETVRYGRFILGVHRPRKRRTLDLSPLYEKFGQAGCKRIARRWALANGFIRRRRLKASERRLRTKVLATVDYEWID